jgi:uncharacterized membrane protein YfcA
VLFRSGLVLVPALFATFPGAAPATLFGSNKGAAIWGTAWAARTYARRVQLNTASLLPACACALAGSALGAWGVTQVSAQGLRQALPFVLAAVLGYTLLRKDLGREHCPRLTPAGERRAAMAIGGVIGLYDGFFGPGTGSFFVFLYVRWLGYDFLNASACAKLLNTATNASALLLFAWKGHVWWHLALGMAIANVAGSWFGARLALQRGAGFVRLVFIAVVSALILRTGYDAPRL